MRNRLQSAALSLMMAAALLASGAKAQQVADTAFKPPIPNPAYQPGRGPVIMLDEAHFNFHTADGRYLAFAELLRRDGYVVKPSRSRFDKASLKEGQILVIANALAERNQSDWSLPTPSAFSDEEVGAVRDWVNEGGSLLLIADHMPFRALPTNWHRPSASASITATPSTSKRKGRLYSSSPTGRSKSTRSPEAGRMLKR